MATSNPLLALLGITHPIIQAPMAGISTPSLAAAVSNAGALGSLGAGSSDPQGTMAMIRATRALTSKPFNVNLFCHEPAKPDLKRESQWLEYLSPYFNEFGAQPPQSLHEIYKSFLQDREMLELLLDERPAVVSFHFGLPPASWVEEFRRHGIVTLACATTPQEATLCEQAGVDAIIAQGSEAGGHRGVFDPEKGDAMLGTLALTRLIAATTALPVIAAGGIMDGHGIAAAQALGAGAAQLGTAFVLCPESSANKAYRTALKGPRAFTTAVTCAISGRPARGLVNRMHTDIERAGAPAVPAYPTAYDAGKALHAAASALNNSDFAAHWAGQGAPLARELPAGDLVGLLVAELQRVTQAA
jgi:nitronate monooxygenase